jgi:hypothetical protein
MGRPGNSTGNFRPKWYGQVPETRSRTKGRKSLLSRRDDLKNEMPDSISTYIKLKTISIGQGAFVVSSKNLSFANWEKSCHPHANAKRNRETFGKPVTKKAQKERRSTTLDVVEDDSSFKGKKRKRVSPRLSSIQALHKCSKDSFAVSGQKAHSLAMPSMIHGCAAA